MSDASLAKLAATAGIATAWRDVFGATRNVAPPTLRVMLAALGFPADSNAQIIDSQARMEIRSALPPLVTAEIGRPISLAASPARYQLRHEDGRSFDGYAEAHGHGAAIPPILEPGYHHLTLGDAETVIAVAPPRACTLHDLVPSGRAFAIATQLYALRRDGDGGVGDFAALAEFAASAGIHGAAAVAISPVHAQFSADPDRFSPYAPSSRVALNALHVALPPGQETPAAPENPELIDWPVAARARLAALRKRFEELPADPQGAGEFARFRAGMDPELERHARFETLHAAMLRHDRSRWQWRDWPAEFRDPDGAGVAAFAREHAGEVDFHLFLQFLAGAGLAGAQRAARDAGMPVGLISDLAVGTDPGGSQCWSRQGETLLGLTIGAPPDLFQAAGQGWGLAAFSPTGLVAHGFAAFLDMLRAALAHAGGVRIDHAMGLNRLWMIPEGAPAGEGAYLAFPETDLLRLLRLESQRHRAIVIAEDLGTVPDGFTERLAASGIAGMRVLWFERDPAGRFIPPAHWTHRAAAMTGTHDLATVAGWWRGRDLAWRATLGQTHDLAGELAARDADRALLWQAMRDSGAASGETPAADTPAPAVDAAIRHVGAAASELVMLPVEDALALQEQPNLPGTLDEHPNWRRRLPGHAATLLDAPEVAARLAGLAAARAG